MVIAFMSKTINWKPSGRLMVSIIPKQNKKYDSSIRGNVHWP